MRSVVFATIVLAGQVLLSSACCCGSSEGHIGPVTQSKCASVGGTYCGSCHPPCNVACTRRRLALGPDKGIDELHWSGGTHGSIHRASVDLAKHQASVASWKNVDASQGEKEAEEDAKAIKAWLEHQSAGDLAKIDKNPSQADHLDIKAWKDYDNDSKDDLGSVHRWHAELAKTYATEHKVLLTSDTSASFDDSGRYQPPININYRPTAVRKCCKKSCGVQNYDGIMINGTRIAPESCRVGCDLWLHHSSLNWESLDWHPKLLQKCKKDCSASRLWSDHYNRVTHPNYQGMRHYKNTAGIKDTWLQQEDFYWLKYAQMYRPQLEEHCKHGCETYLSCMQSQNMTLTNEEKLAQAKRAYQNHANYLASIGIKLVNQTKAWYHWQNPTNETNEYHKAMYDNYDGPQPYGL